MTQEEKDLLLKDLSSRLPYKVKVQCINSDNETVIEELFTIGIEEDSFDCNLIEYVSVKPYLFPLSSMTEEQKEEYCQLQQKIIYNSKGFVNTDIMNYINWCYENHLDVNWLIPLDLAIDCTNLNIY